MPYPPEAIAAAIRNAGAHFGSRWRIVPLWVLKMSEEHPTLPRAYLAMYFCVATSLIVWSVMQGVSHPVPAPIVSHPGS